MVFTIGEDGSGSVVSAEGGTGGGSDDLANPLHGGLYLHERQSGVGDIKRVSVSLFGSIPPASSRTDLERMEDGISAVDADMRDDVLAFLVDKRPNTSRFVGQLQSAGIYMTVPGVDLPVWIEGYKNDAPAQQLLALEDAVRKGTISSDALPMPLPGSLALLVVGFPLVVWRRRRA